MNVGRGNYLARTTIDELMDFLDDGLIGIVAPDVLDEGFDIPQGVAGSVLEDGLSCGLRDQRQDLEIETVDFPLLPFRLFGL